MRLVFKMAKLELRNIFYSPIAWFLTFIFLVIGGIYYSAALTFIANQQQLLLKSQGFESFSNSLTSSVLMSLSDTGLMGNVLRNLFLFLPMLTMALINRDFTSGTIKLLYSSPIRLSQIVWGKYMAIMIYNLLLSAILLVFMIAGAFSIKDIDFNQLLAGLIAFYMLVCSFTAIGMFMSSLTHYPIIAAIATFILLFILQRIGGLWQDHDFIRDISSFLSINGRLERMVYGLITTRDIAYYTLITYMFVSFTYINLLHGRVVSSTLQKTLRYVTVTIIVLVVGYFSSRPGYVGYWDLTRGKVNTISQQSQDLLNNLDEDAMEVTMYTNLMDLGKGYANTNPTQRNNYVWNIWDRFVRFKSDIKLNYVLYYDVPDGHKFLYQVFPGMSLDSIARERAKLAEISIDKFLKPAEIRKLIDLAPEDMRTVMQLKYKSRSIFLRMYNDSRYWPDEKHFAAAFKRLATDDVPKIYTLTGNLERSINKTGEREYHHFSIYKLGRNTMINHGFEFDTLDLNRQLIPDDADALILADPKTELSETVINRLHQFIKNQGNVLILGEPGKQDILNPLLQSLGVKLMPGTLVQVSKNETPDKVLPHITLDYTWLIGSNTDRMKTIRKNYAANHYKEVMYPGAVSVNCIDSGFSVSRMTVTNKEDSVWVKNGPLVIDSVPPVLMSEQGDYMLDSFNVSIALKRKIGDKEQRIVVAGDADFLSRNGIRSHYVGVDYLSWMTNEEFPIEIPGIRFTDNLLTVTLDGAKHQRFLFTWVLPGLVIVLGAIILMRRKRQ